MGDKIDLLTSELAKVMERHLEVALAHSERGVEEGCPIYVSKPGMEGLHAHAKQSLHGQYIYVIYVHV